MDYRVEVGGLSSEYSDHASQHRYLPYLRLVALTLAEEGVLELLWVSLHSIHTDRI